MRKISEPTPKNSSSSLPVHILGGVSKRANANPNTSTFLTNGINTTVYRLNSQRVIKERSLKNRISHSSSKRRMYTIRIMTAVLILIAPQVRSLVSSSSSCGGKIKSDLHIILSRSFNHHCRDNNSRHISLTGGNFIQFNRRRSIQLNMATDSRSLQRQYSFLKQGYDGLHGLITNGATLTVERQHQTIFQSSKQQQNAKSNGANTANANGGEKDRNIKIKIKTSADEEELFDLLRQVTEESCRDEKTGATTTLRVAGGWVRDKILATDEFQKATSGVSTGLRLTSKWAASKGRKGTSIISSSSTSTNSLFNKSVFQPLDIDIALDDMLGREFADRLNEWLLEHGRDRISVGVVMKNPEKSKHLETATMKVGQFWIDFVNLRAEEYAGDSRIPDLMRIGTAEEDAFRRDLTINVSVTQKQCFIFLAGRKALLTFIFSLFRLSSIISTRGV